MYIFIVIFFIICTYFTFYMIYHMFVYVYIHIFIFLCIYICMDGVVGLLLCCRGCLAGWCDVPNSGVFSSVRLVTIIRRKQPAVCRGCYPVHTHADPLFPVTSKAFFRLYYTKRSKNSNFEGLFSVYIIPYPPQKKNSILTTDSNKPKPPVLHLKSAVAGQLPATSMV